MRGSQEKLLARSLAFNSRRRPTIIRNSLDSSLQTGVDESLLVGDRAAFRAEFLASGLATTRELAARTSKNCICESHSFTSAVRAETQPLHTPALIGGAILRSPHIAGESTFMPGLLPRYEMNSLLPSSAQGLIDLYEGQ